MSEQVEKQGAALSRTNSLSHFLEGGTPQNLTPSSPSASVRLRRLQVPAAVIQQQGLRH